MRWQLRSVLEGAIWSVVLGLALFCALEAASILFPGLHYARWFPTIFEPRLLDHGALGAIFFTAALAIAILVTVLATPGPVAFARALDHRFGLQERLSTAIEVAARLTPDQRLQDPVHLALLADAETRADRIARRELEAFSLPRVAWAVPILTVGALLLQIVPPMARTPAPAAATIEQDGNLLGSQQAAEMSQNLRRIGEALEQDAEQRSDPYLRSIARALVRVGDSVAHAPTDRRELVQQLSRLLAHAQSAYAHGVPGAAPAERQSATAQLQAALRQLAGDRQAATQPNEPAPDPAPQSAGPTAAGAPPAQRMERQAATKSASAEQRAATRKLLGADIPWLFVDEDGAEVDPRSQIERLLAEEERRARAAMQPAGAATNAGEGEGDRAGDGSRPLGKGNAANSSTLAATEQMLLPDSERRDGGRIRIDLPPDASLSAVAPPTADTTGGWRPHQEHPVERPALAADGRRIVGRYFKRENTGNQSDTPGGRRP